MPGMTANAMLRVYLQAPAEYCLQYAGSTSKVQNTRSPLFKAVQ